MKRKISLLLFSFFVMNYTFAGFYTSPTVATPVKIIFAQPKTCYLCNWSQSISLPSYRKCLNRAGIHVIEHPYSLRIIIPNWTLFHPISSVFISTAGPTLYQVASLLKQLPGARIIINGYTDNVQSSKENKRQSLLIAQKIAGYLWTQNIPLPSQKLTYQGRGSANPIASNLYIRSMGTNRRVEIEVKLPKCKKSNTEK